MQNKMKKAGTLKKNKNSTCLKFINILVIFTLLLSFIFICFNTTCVIAGVSSYTPASPTGNTSTDINVENEYTVFTSEVGSYWMFDWGDGSYSDWIKVGVSDNSISQSHSWSSYDDYEVKVKHRSIYMVESAWSLPLTVKVTSTIDLDRDGYNNDMERSYGTDPNNPNNYPIDTDKDGFPDDVSPDGKYAGDNDADNDGLSNQIEQMLGSNPKKASDVNSISIDGTTYYIVDTDENDKPDKFYNPVALINTTMELTNEGNYLIDFNGDGKWEYSYSDEVIRPYEQPFEIPWLYVILGVILIVILIILILFKKGILYLYQEEYVIEE